MKRETRIKILTKLAKKDQVLSGRKSRKDVEKHLFQTKKVFDKTIAEKRQLSSTIQGLQEKLDNLESIEEAARKDMHLCHRVLRNMDFTNSSDIKIKDDDVAYSIDGKWCSYNEDTGEVSKYEKPKKEDTEDVSDADDINNIAEQLLEVEKDLDDKDLMEGVDITI